MDDTAVLAIADPENLVEWFAVRVFHDGMIELPAGHKIDVLARHQRLIRLDVPVGTHKGDLQAGIGLFDFADEFDVAPEADRGREQNEEFVVLANLNGLPPVDLVRRSIQQPAPRNHPRRVGQPHGIPVRLNFASRGPPRTCSAVEVFKARRIQ